MAIGAVNQNKDPFGINWERHEKITLKPAEDKLQKIQDKIDISRKKDRALSELNLKTKALAKSLDDLSNTGFNKKSSSIGTSDHGHGDNYLDVTCASNAHKGEFDISVHRVATKARTTITANGGGGFVPGHIYGDSNIRISSNHALHPINLFDIAVPLGATNASVISVINTALRNANAHAEAILVPCDHDGNLRTIEIRSTETGAGQITVVSYSAMDLHQHPLPNIHYHTDQRILGHDADIIIEGQRFESHTNKIVGQDGTLLAGVTLDLKRANSRIDPAHPPRHPQTIHIDDDKGEVEDGIHQIMDSYNELAKFGAEQKARKPNSLEYEETAYLARAPELPSMEGFLRNFLNRIPGMNPAFNSLYSIGLALETVPARLGDGDNAGTPSYRKLFIKNKELFEKSLKDNFEDIKKLFVDQHTITPAHGNRGTLSYGGADKILHHDYLGKNVTIDVDVHAHAATITHIDGVVLLHPINALYDVAHNSITFPANSGLEGLRLSYVPNGAVGAERFTFNLIQGLSTHVQINAERNTRSIDSALQRTRDNALKQAAELAKAEKSLKEAKAKIEKEKQAVDAIAQQAEFTKTFFEAQMAAMSA